MRYTLLRDPDLPAYWVDERRRINGDSIVAYEVCCRTTEAARHVVRTFRTRNYGWLSARQLAGGLCDGLNAEADAKLQLRRRA